MTTGVRSTERRAAADRPALRRVVAVDPERFAQEHWDRAPLLSSSGGGGGRTPWPSDDPDRYADLFSLPAADELLSARGLRTPFLRVAKDGAVIPAARFTAPGGVGATVADQVDAAAVARLFADGATVVLQGLHRAWPELGEFTRDLSADLGHPVQVNGYLTPPSAQGFAAHYDTHDVFVLQVAGSKHWTIHAPVLERPWADEPSDGRRESVAERAAETPFLDLDLIPGDALYLPRGWLHSARAGTEPTLHLTFGVHPVTVRDVLRAALEEAVRDERARLSLPLGLIADDEGSHGSADKSAVQVLADLTVDQELVARAVRGRITRDTRPEPVRPVAQAALAGALTPSTGVRLRRHLDATVGVSGTTTSVLTPDRELVLPPDVLPDGDPADMLARVLRGDPVCANDLAAEPEQVLRLLQLLVREAVLVPAD